MKRIPTLYILFLIPFSIISSCHSSYQSQSLQYKSYSISIAGTEDSLVSALLIPYSDSVNRSMNKVIGIAEKTLEKKKPEGTLGNFMANAFLVMAEEKYNTNVDAAFMNDGGIRLDQLTAGPVTKGKIFELMPFDNVLILQKIKGEVLQQFLDLIAGQGGWPVAGLMMQIRNKKAVNVVIGGKPLDPEATYTTANSDFIANGGGNADMLRPIQQISNGYLVRDALFDYIKKRKEDGKNIDANLENRVTNVQ
ncbi:MAG: 5'-nucleotidase C-terminal domain-containing protein [Chitinophagaceae bacterium]